MSHFPNEVCSIFLNTYRNISSVFVERLPFKTIQKVHKLLKNKDVEIFRIIRRVSQMLLKQNAATFSSKKCKAQVVVALIVLKIRTKSFGNGTEIATKTTKLQTFRHFLVNLRPFSFTN